MLEIETAASKEIFHLAPTESDDNARAFIHPYLDWSCAGDTLLFSMGKHIQIDKNLIDSSDIWAADLAGNARRLIKNGFYPVYSPDGKKINAVVIVVWKGKEVEPSKWVVYLL